MVLLTLTGTGNGASPLCRRIVVEFNGEVDQQRQVELADINELPRTKTSIVVKTAQVCGDVGQTVGIGTHYVEVGGVETRVRTRVVSRNLLADKTQMVNDKLLGRGRFYMPVVVRAPIMRRD